MRTTRTIIAIAVAVVGGLGLAGCATPSTATAAQLMTTPNTVNAAQPTVTPSTVSEAQPTATSRSSAARMAPPDHTAMQTSAPTPQNTKIPPTALGAVRDSPAWQAAEDLSIDLGSMVDLYTAAAEAGVLETAKSSIDAGAPVVVADIKSVVGYTEQGAYSVAQMEALATMITEAGEIGTAIDEFSHPEVTMHSQNFQAAAEDFVAAS